MEEYLTQYGSHLSGRVVLLTYEELTRGKALPIGTYIFSAIDRLFPCERELAARFGQELSAASSNIILLNHPGRVLCRYELLRKCFALERNRFDVYRATNLDRCQKFPVFIRPENEHKGSITQPSLHAAGTHKGVGDSDD